MKVLQCIGTRPNLTKFINITGKDRVVWTGQHYDKELIYGIHTEFIDLKAEGVGSMINGVARNISELKPDLVVVYGDTRSALAGALAADQADTPLAHIEAGVRLGDMTRPEERTRRVIDHLSDYLFCINNKHAMNLYNEDIKGRVFIVGDLHYDRYLKQRKHLDYMVATIHRAENTESKRALEGAIKCLKKDKKVFFLVHPRTQKLLDKFKIKLPKNVIPMNPIPYDQAMQVLRYAELVITDSGGLVREAFLSGVPVEPIGKTEWASEITMFGQGNAGEKIRKILKEEVRLR